MADDLMSKRMIGRRSVMKAGAALAVAPLTSSYVHAQKPSKLNIFTLQSQPLQLKAYARMVASFQAANPGVEVSILPISQTDLWAKLAASYAGGDVPDLVLQMTAENVVSMYGQGLLDPLDDVIKNVGESDFEPAALNLYRDKGQYFAVPASNNCVSLLWYRKDLLAEAGIAPPKTWTQYLAMAKALTKNGKFGTSLPFGRTAMTNSITWTLIYEAGGYVIAPDMSVVFNSDKTVQVLEFLKEMHQYVPPGANRFDFVDVLNAYVSGTSASCMYTGRTIVNVNTQNPAIADQIACVPFPIPEGGKPWWSGAFEAIIMPKAGKNKEMARRFAAWNFKKDEYIAFLNATPGHQIPMLKSVLGSEEYRADPMLKKYPDALNTTIDTLSKAHAASKPEDDFPLILRAGEIQGSNIFSETIQRVVIEKQAPKAAAAWGQDRIAQLMKS